MVARTLPSQTQLERRKTTTNFDLTGEQQRWRDLACEYAQEEIRPRAAQLDKEQKFPYDIAAKMAELGLMGLTVPEEYGGSGGDFVAYNMALKEVSRADTSVGITMEAHVSLGCAPIVSFGTSEQKEHFLSEAHRSAMTPAFLKVSGRTSRSSECISVGGRRP